MILRDTLLGDYEFQNFRQTAKKFFSFQNVSEELEIRVQELEVISDQVRGLPADYAEVKMERNIEGKLEFLNEDIHALKDNLEDRIKNLKEDAKKNEQRQKEVQIMDANLASIQKKVLFMLKSSSVPLKEEIEVWQDLQKPSRDLQQVKFICIIQ